MKDGGRDYVEKEKSHIFHAYHYQAFYRKNIPADSNLRSNLVIVPMARRYDKEGDSRNFSFFKIEGFLTDLRPLTGPWVEKLAWRTLYDHCTLEEIAQSMKGEDIDLFADYKDTLDTSDQCFIEQVYSKPDTLRHSTFLDRYIALLKKTRYGTNEKERKALRMALQNVSKWHGGRHDPPHDMRRGDAEDILKKFAGHLKGKCLDFLKYAHLGSSAADIDLTSCHELRRYFSECNLDPRLAELTDDRLNKLVNYTAVFIDDVIHSRLNMTSKQAFAQVGRSPINPSEK